MQNKIPEARKRLISLVDGLRNSQGAVAQSVVASIEDVIPLLYRSRAVGRAKKENTKINAAIWDAAWGYKTAHEDGSLTLAEIAEKIGLGAHRLGRVSEIYNGLRARP